MQLTENQLAAAQLMLQPHTRIGGYAGTGKSVTVAEACRQALADKTKVTVAAPTNKAAMVLRRVVPQGIPISTLHALTTTPSEVPEKDEEGKVVGTRMAFSPKSEPVPEHVIIDEASMLGESFLERVKHLLKSYSLVGDPFQLPPVKDRQILDENNCNAMLTEVMRQAADNPALAYATELRSGGRRKAQEFGLRAENGIKAADIQEMADDNAICITYTNADRHWFNREIRKFSTGRARWHPRVGDKVVCRTSDIERGLFKGLAGKIASVEGAEDDYAYVHVAWDGPCGTLEHKIDARHLAGKHVPWDDQFGDHIEYGFAVTCHAAQGSSWDRVFLVPNVRLLLRNQGPIGMRRWMYTGLTRVTGAGEVTIVDNG